MATPIAAVQGQFPAEFADGTTRHLEGVVVVCDDGSVFGLVAGGALEASAPWVAIKGVPGTPVGGPVPTHKPEIRY